MLAFCIFFFLSIVSSKYAVMQYGQNYFVYELGTCYYYTNKYINLYEEDKQIRTKSGTTCKEMEDDPSFNALFAIYELRDDIPEFSAVQYLWDLNEKCELSDKDGHPQEFLYAAGCNKDISGKFYIQYVYDEDKNTVSINKYSDEKCTVAEGEVITKTKGECLKETAGYVTYSDNSVKVFVILALAVMFIF
ncbi:hypothetical protein EIN_161410 [Entamoeba invadens IP1]|uniref:Transmembrane protein n=1 Tax=Entamoeba invadens IP1 TaxID=370355 RepID=A0A0A1U1Q6_ENTIV|nr:hypothetical protein EIN_161410 [Entamoeba invadens IP1]ELP86547.1 hypothetical protein EIN_161410 [Entamoeba invadens IP1]|eukprot:XP_004185893.1 hypothetical protein EIN_161410 [Entamoeba invadens IP1]